MKTLLLLLIMTFEPTFSLHEKRSPIMIAVLLPKDTMRPCAISHVRPALEIAVEKVQSPSGLLPGYAVEINYADTNCSSADAMNEAINFFVRNKSNIFFGPCCDYAAAPVGRQTKYWKIPMITTALARDFAVEKGLKYPMVTRVGGSINKMAEFFAEIFQVFQWYQVKIIYEPKGLDKFLDHMCHITADSLHFTLSEKYDILVPYYKFETTQEALSNMQEQIGLDNAVLYV